MNIDPKYARIYTLIKRSQIIPAPRLDQNNQINKQIQELGNKIINFLKEKYANPEEVFNKGVTNYTGQYFKKLSPAERLDVLYKIQNDIDSNSDKYYFSKGEPINVPKQKQKTTYVDLMKEKGLTYLDLYPWLKEENNSKKSFSPEEIQMLAGEVNNFDDLYDWANIVHRSLDSGLLAANVLAGLEEAQYTSAPINFRTEKQAKSFYDMIQSGEVNYKLEDRKFSKIMRNLVNKVLKYKLDMIGSDQLVNKMVYHNPT